MAPGGRESRRLRVTGDHDAFATALAQRVALFLGHRPCVRAAAAAGLPVTVHLRGPRRARSRNRDAQAQKAPPPAAADGAVRSARQRRRGAGEPAAAAPPPRLSPPPAPPSSIARSLALTLHPSLHHDPSLTFSPSVCFPPTFTVLTLWLILSLFLSPGLLIHRSIHPPLCVRGCARASASAFAHASSIFRGPGGWGGGEEGEALECLGLPGWPAKSSPISPASLGCAYLDRDLVALAGRLCADSSPVVLD